MSRPVEKAGNAQERSTQAPNYRQRLRRQPYSLSSGDFHGVGNMRAGAIPHWPGEGPRRAPATGAESEE